jgi:excisionase family DNA binding protein
MDTDIMTIKDVASYLKITEKTAYRLTADGERLVRRHRERAWHRQ